MSVLDRFLPPPGAPGAVRDGARCCRDVAGRLQELCDGVQSRPGTLTSSWSGPAKEAFVEKTWTFLRAADDGAGQLRDLGGVLDKLADGIEAAQNEYHQRMATVVVTAAVGVVLTAATLTASDEVAVGAVAVELATATELATTAAAEATSLLATLAGQAARLALRATVLTGVSVAADGASGMIAYSDADPLHHLHLAEDVEFGVIGALTGPVNAGLLGVAGRVGGGGLLRGAGRSITPLLADGVAWIGAHVAVREALRQGVDPGELVFVGAGALLGGAGRVAARRLAPIPVHALIDEPGLGESAPQVSFSYPKPDMVVPPDGGELLPGVAPGVVGQLADNGKGLKYPLPARTLGIDLRVRWIRVMDPTTDARYPYPHGYVNYMNDEQQAVDPRTGRTIGRKDPLWHIELQPRHASKPS